MIDTRKDWNWNIIQDKWLRILYLIRLIKNIKETINLKICSGDFLEPIWLIPIRRIISPKSKNYLEIVRIIAKKLGEESSYTNVVDWLKREIIRINVITIKGDMNIRIQNCKGITDLKLTTNIANFVFTTITPSSGTSQPATKIKDLNPITNVNVHLFLVN